jgi:hypothetical protein
MQSNSFDVNQIINDYIAFKPNRIDNNNRINENKIKNEFSDLDLTNYDNLNQINYTISFLKTQLKKYKLRVTGNKTELIKRLYYFLNSSKYIIKIQRLFRGSLVRKMIQLRGTGLKCREKCVNTEDFLTMDELKNISLLEFFSYQDDDGKIYGFNIISIYNLIQKSTKEPTNPYTRQPIHQTTINNIKKIINICKALKTPINIIIKNVENDVSNKKRIELKTLDIFQHINSLGNYSDPNWFLSLSRNQLIRFYRELYDIWSYRANLSDETKIKICPPRGIVFTCNERMIIINEVNILVLQSKILSVIEKLVYSGIDNDHKTLGCYYILAALTLVSPTAASSLSWLHQSVVHY